MCDTRACVCVKAFSRPEKGISKPGTSPVLVLPLSQVISKHGKVEKTGSVTFYTCLPVPPNGVLLNQV